MEGEGSEQTDREASLACLKLDIRDRYGWKSLMADWTGCTSPTDRKHARLVLESNVMKQDRIALFSPVRSRGKCVFASGAEVFVVSILRFGQRIIVYLD